MVSDDDARRARLWERDAGRQFTGVDSYFFLGDGVSTHHADEGKMDPERAITRLFFALIAPVTIAILQLTLPSILPAELSIGGGDNSGNLDTSEARVRGTIGH